ncbi:class II aaRS and biotin synthetase [Parathielavia hyrcaniae]|uniref:Class II aaRS and biotin synthetase n=1 Tax=Parathielavia hyrcaniae TaxID=113614 RepID=A0AAN6PYL3_9PEZI|nr:class II aaRS and biotin synthetase [Parathielavia hyrcaniae]
MPTQKLNVLVYTGTGSTIESVRHCIYSLRRLLGPNYAVNPITESALLKEPWAPTCALLVFPGGADLGYCRVLDGAGNRSIAQFVRRGGAYLGFCAGGYYGSRRCEFEIGNPDLEVTGSRELAFFPGTCRGGAFKGFQYHSERGAKAARISVAKTVFAEAPTVPYEFRCYYNGGGVFVDADKLEESGPIQILAEYTEDLAVESGQAKAAIVYCKVADGAAILTGPHPEFDAVILGHQSDVPGYDDLTEALREDEEARTSFLKACLTKLGLEVSQGTCHLPSLSRLHFSSLNHLEASGILCSFDDIVTKDNGEDYIKGDTDLFHLEKPESRWSLAVLSDALASDFASVKKSTSRGSPDPTADHSHIPKRIVSHEEAWPEPKETPYFNHSVYYASLREFRAKESEAETWGDVLMYGEVVTSTNTLLEKNHNLLSKLPTGFTFAATTQVAGRGRGANVWVAPPGSLIMSTVINHPAHIATSRPIVFIQYLAALATVEAVKSYDEGYADMPIKIKWPNDVYVRDPGKPNEVSYVKVCGILANCAYSAGNYQVVLGIGINTNNGRPTTSLDALLPMLEDSSSNTTKKKPEPFRIERLLARILTRLEVLYGEFCRHGFSRELEGRYYRHWLHTNQVVTLEAEGGVRARVVGITRDWGMLMAQELAADGVGGDGALRPTGKVWALQSDENSFDFWRGLVKRKI